LQAQAIAARTYAITTAKASGSFDEYADTRSQVYGGVAAETPATNQAVADTRGQVVTYGGQPVVTFFFSTSGGRTENVENTPLGTQPLPWLRSVDDPYDNVSPEHRWKPKTLSLKRVGRELGSLVKGAFKGIRVTRRGASPRIMTAQIVGSRGTTDVDGATLRAKLDLLDTWAYFTSISSKSSDPSGGAVASRIPLNPAVGTLDGSVIGPARGALLHVEKQDASGWHEVGRVHVGRGGAYRWVAHGRGTYRVVYQDAPGPATRVG
jgi:stage II sporulation protein D